AVNGTKLAPAWGGLDERLRLARLCACPSKVTVPTDIPLTWTSTAWGPSVTPCSVTSSWAAPGGVGSRLLSVNGCSVGQLLTTGPKKLSASPLRKAAKYSSRGCQVMVNGKLAGPAWVRPVHWAFSGSPRSRALACPPATSQ